MSSHREGSQTVWKRLDKIIPVFSLYSLPLPCRSLSGRCIVAGCRALPDSLFLRQEKSYSPSPKSTNRLLHRRSNDCVLPQHSTCLKAAGSSRHVRPNAGTSRRPQELSRHCVMQPVSDPVVSYLEYWSQYTRDVGVRVGCGVVSLVCLTVTFGAALRTYKQASSTSPDLDPGLTGLCKQHPAHIHLVEYPALLMMSS